jgi:hypothetical protein
MRIISLFIGSLLNEIKESIKLEYFDYCSHHGKYKNELSTLRDESPRWDLNPWPRVYETLALPAELLGL